MKNFLKLHSSITQYAVGVTKQLQHNHLVNIIQKQPIPKWWHTTFPENNIFDKPIIRIPIFADNDIQMKMIVWKPMSYLEPHYHDSADCYFLGLQNGLVHTILDPSGNPYDSKCIHPHYYEYINNSIGPHFMVNCHPENTVISFHIYTANLD